MYVYFFLAVFSSFLFFSHGVPTKTSENFLDLIQLNDHPLAVCNDGTSAVYYRKPLNSNQDTKKILIYMKGGGFCVPFVHGKLSYFKTSNNVNKHLDPFYSTQG